MVVFGLLEFYIAVSSLNIAFFILNSERVKASISFESHRLAPLLENNIQEPDFIFYRGIGFLDETWIPGI